HALGTRALVVAPFVWVATELGRTHLFTGFPWVLLGYSQVTAIPVAQFASVAGVYGLSALVAGVSAALAAAAPRLVHDRRPGMARGRGAPPARVVSGWSTRYAPVGLMALLVLGIGLWGSLRVRNGGLTRTGVAVRVGLVQGNIDQAVKYDPAHVLSIFGDYMRMTRQAIGEGAEFVLWPESSTPFYFEDDRGAADQVRLLAAQARVPILVGSDQVERPPVVVGRFDPAQRAPSRYYNSAFLVGANGRVAGVYRKMHLVPFGEYVPLKQVFFFAGHLVEAVSDFSAGDAAVLLPVQEHLVSTAICYEIVYPNLVRESVRGGSELLTTITNDAWFGETSAPYQHFQQASMRAIENGRYLVRSANTGISGVVDPYGRVLSASRLYEPAVLVGDARFLRTTTIYTRTGDVFAYASAILAAAALVAARRRVR
ncbi:MAG: apolipoprotein N-acyltransferase, partial [Acidobacteriota bacterium]